MIGDWYCLDMTYSCLLLATRHKRSEWLAAGSGCQSACESGCESASRIECIEKEEELLNVLVRGFWLNRGCILR